MSHHIHPTARIARDVHLGPFVMIGPNVVIGPGTRIEGFASIGTPPEHRDHFHDEGPHGVTIGEDCVVREFVTVNAGTHQPTTVGNGAALLRGSYLGHDVIVGPGATISCNVMLGGHSWIGEGANIGLGAAIRQFLCVGAYAMVGMNSTVTRDIAPFTTAYGSPATIRGVNRLGLERVGLDTGCVERWWNSAGGAAPSGRESLLPARERALERRWRAAIARRRPGLQ